MRSVFNNNYTITQLISFYCGIFSYFFFSHSNAKPFIIIFFSIFSIQFTKTTKFTLLKKYLKLSSAELFVSFALFYLLFFSFFYFIMPTWHSTNDCLCWCRFSHKKWSNSNDESYLNGNVWAGAYVMENLCFILWFECGAKSQGSELINML